MKIHTKYGAKKQRSQFDLILNAFLFGVVSYIILMLIYRLIGLPLNILALDQDGKKLLDSAILPEILWATLIALFCGIVFVYAENRKFLTRVFQKIGLTKRFGDEDVWDFVFNSNSVGVEWVYFRDFSERVVYCGYVRLFSESGQLRELLLQNVIVYDFDGNELYRRPMLYLAREQANIHIEFPDAERTSNDQGE
ncbi:DUF6338 family protein [Rhodoblastus sphagnicola]|nr:DUF6338 family protein [Rhodoblastus sphagnicola]